MIHPTAMVSPKAELGREVRIGPGAIVEAGTVLGDRCEVRAYAVIAAGTRMGPGNRIGYGAVLGAEPQDLSWDGSPSRVVLGEGNVIREHVTIHRGAKPETETRIGDGNYLMVGCHVGHNCVVGDRTIIVNHVLLAGYVQVGDRAFLGGGSVFHQHVRIGELAMVRGGIRIGMDVPPFLMAVDENEVCGVNRVGLRRAGFSEEVRRRLEDAYRVLYESGRNVSQALEEMERRWPDDGEVRRMIAFIRGSRRGICMPRRRRRRSAPEAEGSVTPS
ncbi:Acyl-[acyl-carrier-protein]--UDP-N-acetylglucosamine O-acyltransferase [Methylacidimicrobium sp. AP8]|uniref:acyl-ACP--UDP-N-acetylglucosamine O-acyltransferase n=1 Tax=Methylacidimicrobium sp. AP8 TaxID=2730359 RepID=UPI0018C19089|nr:acyl-ACP--UDP-N-acetylglucosamine O-acyltransferase [Methylacidimicrobium sp. AP8]CAB4244289.1 Acyl-[acyl-carrier-protein]--UDP-N-acetylglucosamine O-acyltransferase [Methylacidimicrobium sp. AP8]